MAAVTAAALAAVGLGASVPAAESGSHAKPGAGTLWLFGGTMISGWLALAIYTGASGQGQSAYAVGFLASVGAVAAGGLTGFLFGIPRAIVGSGNNDLAGVSSAGSNYRANTNLEQISDWLTKILVGVGLVQFAAIAAALRGLVDFVAAGLNPTKVSDADTVVAASLLLFYAVIGFLAGYVATRVVLLQLFEKAELIDLQTLVRQADQSISDWLDDTGESEQQLRAVLAATPEWYRPVLLDRVQRTKNTTRNASEADRAGRLLTILADLS
jgi:hypothetical protein